MIDDIKTYRVTNLRSIKDSGEIPLSPLSVLVGRNGSGKSSFMRFFQILQQSIKPSKRSSLLFYGDDVDFGSFEDAICKAQNTDDFIGFGFSFSHHPNILYIRRLLNSKIDGKLFCKIKSNKEHNYLNSVSVEILGDKFEIEFVNKKIEKITINNLDTTKHIEKVIVRDGFIVPEVYGRSHEDYYYISTQDYHPRYRAYIEAFVNKISWHIHGRTKETTKFIKAASIRYTEKNEFINQLSNLYESGMWVNFTKSLSRNNKLYNEVRATFALTYLPTILLVVNDILQEIANSIYYIGPSRALAQRYYRIQELDVSRIDPSGYNMPAFIDNMTQSQLTDFKEWAKIFFGFSPTKNSSSGHISIFVGAANEPNFNLSDVGFGYSQVLPILLQLWRFQYDSTKKQSANVSNRKKTHIFLIEQPELHLHPAFQRNLIKAILHTLAEVKNHGSNLKIIIETHSEYIVNEIGKAVETKFIEKEEASIYLFEKENGECNISCSEFDEYGRLINWPFGFFSGDE